MRGGFCPKIRNNEVYTNESLMPLAIGFLAVMHVIRELVSIFFDARIEENVLRTLKNVKPTFDKF